MSEKPTFDSVTSERCSCGHLESAADDPDSPIAYDPMAGEFHIVSLQPAGGYSMVYHCPFCGGVAPPSKRASLFAYLTSEELDRLLKLTAGITTVEEAVARLGQPDDQVAAGQLVTEPGSTENEPPTTTSYRTFTFRRLSETAEVTLVDYTPAPVRFSFAPKYVGPPRDEG